MKKVKLNILIFLLILTGCGDLSKNIYQPGSIPTQLPSISSIYHGNINSNVFHSSICQYYDCSNCTVNFNSREEAIKAGYRPCKICNP